MLLVTGASGFLGGTLAREAVAWGHAVAGTYHSRAFECDDFRVVRADLTKPDTARALLCSLQPQAVVNCAAFTSVDGCERNPERARMLNAELPLALATACAETGIGLTHISTDSVFDGNRGGYTELDLPAPLNVYARTKLDGECAVLHAMPEALVIRTNFIGVSPGRRTGLADWLVAHFEKRARIRGFTDVTFAPLLANDLARIAFEMMEMKLCGIYHLAARDSVTKYEFACRLGDALGFDSGLVHPDSIAAAKFWAPRPLNTSLSPVRIEAALGRSMATVASAIAGYAGLHSTFHTLRVPLAPGPPGGA